MVLNGLSQSSCRVYSLTWSEFGSSLAAVAKNLRNHEDLTDVTVSVGGKIFPAHKLILSAASPLLMELLKNTKCHHPILMLAGISSSDFEILLDFVYQGEVKLDSEKLPSLLQAAQLLDIRALSPNALVLNSPQESFSVSMNINQEAAFSNSNEESSKNDSVSSKTKKSKSHIMLQKRKRSNHLEESSTDFSFAVNSCKKIFHPGKIEDKSHCESATPESVSSVKMNDMENQEGTDHESVFRAISYLKQWIR